jgi:hypothetical protein
MRKAELQEAVAELLGALRHALLEVNAERRRRRPKGQPYTAPVLGREELLQVERRVEKEKQRKGGAG